MHRLTSRITLLLDLVAALPLTIFFLALPPAAQAQVYYMAANGAPGGYPGYGPGLPALPPLPGTPTAAPSQPEMGSGEPNPLPNLPRPTDQPASLFQPAPSGQVYGCPDLENPYLQEDPLLDCEGLARPGWLFDVDLDYLGSHVFNHVGQFATPTPITVPFMASVPMAKLDWTVAPRFEAGYRLPSGFGEVDFAFRFLNASGSGATDDPIAAPDGTASSLSHLDLRVADLDYANNETSLTTMLGPGYGMKWRIGLRTADTTFDSRANEAFGTAAAGSGFYERFISNHYWGIGPHGGVDLSRRWQSSGFGIVFRLDSGLLFGKTTQKFSELSTTAGGDEEYELNNLQTVPMLSGYLGIEWRPPQWTKVDLQLGYTGEYWWNVGRLSDPDVYNGLTAGEFGLNGVVLRLEYNY